MPIFKLRKYIPKKIREYHLDESQKVGWAIFGLMGLVVAYGVACEKINSNIEEKTGERPRKYKIELKSTSYVIPKIEVYAEFDSTNKYYLLGGKK